LGARLGQLTADNSMIMIERLPFRWATEIHMLALRDGELTLASEGEAPDQALLP